MRAWQTRIVILAAGLPVAVSSGQVLHDNGGLITTPNPVCIPAGGFASQLQSAGGFPNGLIGLGHQLTATADNRIADDFTITQPEGWTIAQIQFFDYQTNAPGTVSPISAINLRIWNAKPGTAGAAVIFGDTTTNRLSGSEFISTFRVAATCSLARALFRSTVSLDVSLAPGTYWLDWQAVGSQNYTGPWAPPVTITGQRGKPGANATQFDSAFGVWEDVIDRGPSPDLSSPPVPQDFPFVILGSVNVPGCYANCDESTAAPLLTANDFQCFLNMFASGSSYANCDQSSVPPVLTANDFQCFLNAFAAGCS